MSAPTIVFPDSEVVEGQWPVATEFFTRVLGVSESEVYYNDETQLRDLTGCCGDGLLSVREDCSLEEYYDAWDVWVLGRLEAMYGFRPALDIPLPVLFAQIEAAKQTRSAVQ